MGVISDQRFFTPIVPEHFNHNANMQSAYCAMTVASKYLPYTQELAIARHHLQQAIALADKYHQTQWSIYWQKARASTKKQIRQQLNQLAFDSYTHLVACAIEINEYAEKQSALSMTPPPQWDDLIINLRCAFLWIEDEHEKEIQLKQLSLF